MFVSVSIFRVEYFAKVSRFFVKSIKESVSIDKGALIPLLTLYSNAAKINVEVSRDYELVLSTTF